MLKIVNRKPVKVIVDRSKVEDLLNAVILYLESDGDCWDEVLGRVDTDKSFNLSQELREMSNLIGFDLRCSQDFDY